MRHDDGVTLVGIVEKFTADGRRCKSEHGKPLETGAGIEDIGSHALDRFGKRQILKAGTTREHVIAKGS